MSNIDLRGKTETAIQTAPKNKKTIPPTPRTIEYRMTSLIGEINEDHRSTCMEVLSAMYTPEELVVDELDSNKFTLKLPFPSDSPVALMTLHVTLPPSYPSELTLSLNLSSVSSSRSVPNAFSDSLKAALQAFLIKRRTGDAESNSLLLIDALVFVQGNDDEDGGVVSDIATRLGEVTALHGEKDAVEGVGGESPDDDSFALSRDWQHSEALTSKGSVFVASATRISSVDEVPHLLRFHANKDSRHRRATHHMSGYRIIKRRGEAGVGRIVLYHDNDDDGEDGAGRKLAILLENVMGSDVAEGVDVLGVLLIVSRWYGGVKLGPKRFHHISSVGRDALMKVLNPPSLS